MQLVVVDEDGTVLDAGVDVDALRARLAGTVRQAIADAAPIVERRGITDWDLGALPRVVETARAGHQVQGYPALLDDDDSVSVRVLTNADLQARVMRGGVRRLLLLTAAPTSQHAQRGLDRSARLAIAASGLDLGALAADAVIAAVDRVLADHELPWDADAFEVVRSDVRARAAAVAADALAAAADVLAAADRVRVQLARMVASGLRPTSTDAAAHLERLVGAGFVLRAGTRRLPDVHRYVRGIEYRLERVAEDLDRDRRRMADVVPLEGRYARHVRRGGPTVAARADGREVSWLLEELRMSLFAQPLGVHGPVSVRRVTRALDRLGAPS